MSENRKIRFPCPICHVEHVVEARVEIGDRITKHSLPHVGKVVTLFIDAAGIVRSTEVADPIRSMTRLPGEICPTVNGIIVCNGCLEITSCTFRQLRLLMHPGASC